jgi:tetratricopeptide (TPR) repeat protein/tRNA A-37 threonylcarbamoyl transferase component Bud32
MREDRLNSLLVAWQEQQFHGRDVSAAELCRDCPELAEELSRRIEVLRRMNDLLRTRATVAAPDPAAAAPATGNGQTGVTGDARGETFKVPGQAQPDGETFPGSAPGYEILGELGRGGMGVVYKARQRTLNRTVALKMILAGSHAGAEATARFLQEAETIARLKHPNVVQVYDFGSHEGKPYFSLEYLEGGSLAHKLRGEPQPPVQAAQTVQTLARAVQAAHEQGVVHRDLKPANVLLATDGTPKITDFGLAKQGDSGMTATGEVLGTPSYMAPEQAEGKARAVGPAADIYALGAILYELLTGRPPFRGASAWDTLQLVVGTDPVPPSQLQPKVPRDLETVCLKCLRKEPAGRYDSASALAEDLRRFLGGEPVVARPVARSERLWRWCRRNPVVAGLSTMLLLLLIGGFVAVTLLWRHAEDQRADAVAARERAQDLAAQANRQRTLAQEQTRLARAQAEKARREANKATWTVQLLTEMFRATDPLGLNGIPSLKPRAGEILTAHQILDRVADKVARDLYLKEEPETQANLMDTIGNVYCTLGQTAKAQPLLEKALALRRRLPKDHPDLATTLHNLGFLHHQTGDYAAADRYYREALAIRQRHARADPRALSATLVNLGWLLHDQEDYPAAEKMFKEAIALRDRGSRKDGRAVAVARAGLVASYLTQGKYAQAFPLYSQAMATLRKVEGTKGLAESIDLLQRGLIARGQPALGRFLGLKDDRAIEHCLERSLVLAREALGNHHAYVALVLHEQAYTLAQHDKAEAAERQYEDCLRIAREYGLHHPKATILLHNYCFLLQRRGKKARADRLLAEALEARRRRYPANHRCIADLLVIRAALLAKPGSVSRRQWLREALTIYCNARVAPPLYAPECVGLLAESLTAPDSFAVACELARAARSAKQKGMGDRFLDLAMVALGEARAKGFKDAKRLRQDKDLAGLRGRKDFQKLLVELQGSSGQ